MRKHFQQNYLQRMTELLTRESFDLIHCEWTHYGAYVTDLHNYPLFLSSHNIEAMPWQRLYAHERNPVKRSLLYLEWQKMLRFERRICREFDHVAAVSNDDCEKFRELYGCKSVTVIPNGIDVGYYDFALPELTRKTIIFSASFDAFVNHDAVIYFLESIFPKILDKDPDIRITFLGKDPPSSLRRYARNTVKFTGTVEDVRPYLAQSSVCVVPIRVAGGSRIKILEAMAQGLPVVSTPEGAEGLEVIPGEHILIARSEDEFAAYTLELMSNKSRAESFSSRARQLVEKRYDWERIAPLLEKAWEETVLRFSQARKASR